MSEVFRPFERLVKITVLGKTLEVPEKNTVLRGFQYISPETIPYGRFCWNQECQYCRVTCQLPDDDEARPMLSCKFIVVPGMVITELAPELVWCLRGKLNSAPSPQGNGGSSSHSTAGHSVPDAAAESSTPAGPED